MELIIAVIIITIIAAVLAAVLVKPPSVPNLVPSALQNIPLVEQGKPIPVVFGTRFIRQPNVMWWGNVEAETIYSDGGK